MIVVTGSSGHLGRLVIDALLAAIEPGAIVAAARDPKRVKDLAERGVVVRPLDYDDPASMPAAFEGAGQVLLISSSEVGRRVPQHRAVIDAVRAVGVDRFVYTSILHADTSPLGLAAEHRETEDAIHASGLAYTVLRNGWYTENYLENLAPALEHGTIIGAAGDGRVAAACRADLAAAAAAVLLDGGHANATYELAGAAFTMAELAASVSAAIGRTISYTDLPADAYRDILVASGVPAEIAELLVDVDRNVAAGNLYAPTDDLERLLGRAPLPLDEVVAATIG